MSERFTPSPERSAQSRETELPRLAIKSIDVYDGDPNDLPSEALNRALREAQMAMGAKNYVSGPEEFNQMMADVGAGNWEEMRAGDVLAAFDKAYEHKIWLNNDIPEERIATLQGYIDGEPEDPTYTPRAINGINIPESVENGDIDPEAWAVEEQARRLEYVFREAEFHLGRTIIIGDEEYEVDGISYTGENGNYTTLSIDLKNSETGAVTYKLEPSDVNEMIKASQERQASAQEVARTPENPQAASKEAPQEVQAETDVTSTTITERIAAKMKDFDDTAAIERAQFEAWLQGHPELLDNTAEEESMLGAPYAPSFTQSAPTTIEAMGEAKEITPEMIEQKRTEALKDFEDFVEKNPAFAALKQEFIGDLEAYLDQLATATQSEYDLVA